MMPGPAAAAMAPNEFLVASFPDMVEADRRKILYENAAKLYNLD